LNRNPEFLKSNPNWPQVLLALDTDVVFPAVPGFDKMYNAARAAVDRALAGDLAAEVALKQGAEEVQKLLSQYWSSRKR
jgi:maltose-binding protein MalE